MSIPIKLDGITAKLEGVGSYGTDSVPTVGDNAVRIAERLWPNLRVEHVFPNERTESASGHLGEPPPATPMGAMVTLSIPFEMKGAGAAYAADSLPEIHPLLVSCGLAMTPNYGDDVSYAPASSSHDSCSIYGYADGNVYKIVGCRSNLRWVITPGETNLMYFDIQGKLKEAPTVSALGSLTYNASLPPSAVGMACVIGALGASDIVMQSAEFDLGAEIQRMDSGNSTDGIGKFAISKFTPRVRFVIETVPLATYNPYTVFTGRTSTTVDWTVGSAQYNRGDLDINSGWQVSDPVPENFNDFAGWGLEIGAEPSNVAIKFD